VVGFDPRPDVGEVAARADSPEEAVAGADAVLSLNSADAAVVAARSAGSTLVAGQLYADLNSAGPQL
jgi:3-hydroxyisobutyrate dehydrogenase-like beta-hydroxyacid dehydrogenase